MSRFIWGAWCGLLILGAACDATLQSGLDERQANDVIVALHAEGIGAWKETRGTGDDLRVNVMVASDDVAPALEALNEANLPRALPGGYAEIFGEPGLVPTATEEQARYVAALSGELSRSLAAIDGVLDSRVHVALAETTAVAFDSEPPRPQASVLIKYAGADAPYDEQAVRALVAGAVQGMEPGDVVVVGVPTVASSSGGLSLVQLGPISVTQGSAGALKGILGGALALHLILASLLVALLFRRRRADGDAAAGDQVGRAGST